MVLVTVSNRKNILNRKKHITICLIKILCNIQVEHDSINSITALDGYYPICTNLVKVIWKVLYPAINDAKRVRDCFPEPPTPTSNALPPGFPMIRDICRKN